MRKSSYKDPTCISKSPSTPQVRYWVFVVISDYFNVTYGDVETGEILILAGTSCSLKWL
jgi:hypothetical protein